MVSHTTPPDLTPYPITSTEPTGFRISGTLAGAPFELHVSEALEELRRFVGAVTLDGERMARGELSDEGFADGSAVIAATRYADEEALARRYLAGCLLQYAGGMLSGVASLEMQRRGKLFEEQDEPHSEEASDAA